MQLYGHWAGHAPNARCGTSGAQKMSFVVDSACRLRLRDEREHYCTFGPLRGVFGGPCGRGEGGSFGLLWAVCPQSSAQCTSSAKIPPPQGPCHKGLGCGGGVAESDVLRGSTTPSPHQGCGGRELTAEAGAEAVTQAAGGGCQAVGGGYCRLQMPLKLALGVRGTVAGHGLGALKGVGGGYLPPFQCHPAPHPFLLGHSFCSVGHETTTTGGLHGLPRTAPSSTTGAGRGMGAPSSAAGGRWGNFALRDFRSSPQSFGCRGRCCTHCACSAEFLCC